MSFIGAVAASVRQTLANFAAEITRPAHLIGAGNFTVASAIRSGGYAGPIGACDVSLYTSVLGAYLNGETIAISEKEDCPEQLRGLLRTGTMAETVASVALLYDLRDVWQAKNPFQVRMLGEYRLAWEELLEKTVAKLIAYREHIGPIEYQAKDGYVYLAELDRDSTVFAFLPTYKSDYERLERLLRAAIEWEPPPYRVMTDKDLSLYHLIDEFAEYFVVLEKDLPEVHAILGKPSALLPRGRSSFSHVICRTSSTKKIVLRNQAKSAAIGPFFPADKEIDPSARLSVARITLAQSIRMNELFLSKRIDYFSGGVGLSVAFFLDGQVFGKADFAPSTHRWSLPDERPMIYLMSDLAVPSQVENRLAKLVLLCLLSRQVQEMVNLRYLEEYGWACTTAFSAKAISMKYRGMFKLHKRKETEGGFLLNYYAPFSGADLSQVLEIWQKKYKK